MRAWVISKEFLVWVDILGFDNLAKEISGKCQVDERIIRSHFQGLLKSKIEELNSKRIILGKTQLGGDDWLLAVDSIEAVLTTISKILDHNTGYLNYEKMPLEIGVGIGEFDRWAELNGNKLIVENSAINFLKSNIIGTYKEIYKKKNSQSIASTFVVLTKSVVAMLQVWDKFFCKGVKNSESELFYIAEVEAIKRRASVFEFLKKIGTTPDGSFGRIDSIFIPPNEYEEIKENLEKQKIVFLIGDPEIGKTYCAIQLMWEYYQKGYVPIWELGGEPPQRERVRRKISDCQIKESSITYFEDIFGKTKFEDREDLRRNIAGFLNKVEQSNARAIISSREKVFSEYEREKLSQSDLRKYSIEMALMKPSYTKEKMNLILAIWAKQFDCKWLSDTELAVSIIGLATNSLTTPLSLHDFASESANYKDLESIKTIINKKSKETKNAFAEEIAQMNKEGLLFFSLVCLLQPVDPTKIEQLYNDHCKTLGLNLELNSFRELENQYISKITRDETHGEFNFKHSSYEEGVVTCWNRRGISDFLLDKIWKLMEDEQPRVRGSCGFSMVKFFRDINFQNDAEKIIYRVIKDKKTASRIGVAEAVSVYFSSIPLALGLKLLPLMIDDKNRYVRRYGVEAVASNFAKMPYDFAVRVLSGALNDRAAEVRQEAVHAVRVNMKAVPRQLVKQALDCNKRLCGFSGWNIMYFACILQDALEKEAKSLGIES